MSTEAARKLSIANARQYYDAILNLIETCEDQQERSLRITDMLEAAADRTAFLTALVMLVSSLREAET